jgi:hypothetical protein
VKYNTFYWELCQALLRKDNWIAKEGRRYDDYNLEKYGIPLCRKFDNIHIKDTREFHTIPLMVIGTKINSRLH